MTILIHDPNRGKRSKPQPTPAEKPQPAPAEKPQTTSKDGD
jgi:hypothetical protein